MPDRTIDKILRQAQAGDTKSVMDLISDFVDEESTTYNKVRDLIKKLRSKNVKDFGRIKDALVEQSQYLKDEMPMTVGGVLKRSISNTSGARKLRDIRDAGTVLTRGTIAEKMAVALGVSDKEDIAENIRKRALQKKKVERDKKTFEKMSNIEKFKHLKGLSSGLDEGEKGSDEIDAQLDKLYLDLKKNNEKTKVRIDELEDEIKKATGNKKRELELQLEKTITDLESSEALFGEPEDSPVLSKYRTRKRRNKLSGNTIRAARTASDFEVDDNGDLILGNKKEAAVNPVENIRPVNTVASSLFNRLPMGVRWTQKSLPIASKRIAEDLRGQAAYERSWDESGKHIRNRPRDALGNVKVTTRQTSVLLNRKPLGVSLVDNTGKLAVNKTEEAVRQQTEYEKKKSKLDARKHDKERIDDQRFWEQQLDEVKEDEDGGGEGGLMAMLAALLAFLGKTFFKGLMGLSKGIWGLSSILGKGIFSGIKFLTKSMWGLTKGVGKLTTKLPVVGKYFSRIGRFLKGTPGRDPLTGRFTKSRNIVQRTAGGTSKLAGKIGGKALGGLSKLTGIGSIAGEEAGAVGGAELAGGAEAIGGAAAGGEGLAAGAVALASNPIGWIVAGVLGAAVAAFLAWKYVIPKKWKEKIKGVVKDIGHAAVSAWHGMSKLVGPIAKGFMGIVHVYGKIYKRIGVDIVGAFSLLWKATKPIRDFFKKILLNEIHAVWTVIQSVGKWFGKAVSGFKKGLEAIKDVLTPVFEFIGHAADIVKHALGKAWDWLQDHVPGLKKATAVVKTAAHAVAQGTTSAIQTVKRTITKAEGALHTAGEQTLQGEPIAVSPSVKQRTKVAAPAVAARLPHAVTAKYIPRRAAGSQTGPGEVRVAAAHYAPVIHVHTPEQKPAPVTRNVPMPNMNIPTLDNTPAIIDDNGLLFLNLSAY